MLVDQFTDKHNAMLVDIAKDNPDTVRQVKEASVSRPDDLDDHHFAFPEIRKFPIYNVKQAKLSRLYAQHQEDDVPDPVMNRIDKTIRLNGEDPDDVGSSASKEASANDALDHYLLPEKKRLFVGSQEDVKEASRALLENQKRLKTASLNQASMRLVKKASEYDVDADQLPTDVYKYAGMTDCDAGKLLDSIEARAQACKTLDDRQTFDKLATVIKRKFPATGVIENRHELTKIASALSDADERAGLEDEYGIRLEDPMKAVFNREKVSAQQIKLGPLKLTAAQIGHIPTEKFEDILGREFGCDSGDREFIAILESLPDDMKQLLGRQLKPHVENAGM